ncbi:COBW domain-containing [Fusarium acutatum]|uniref:COBW domain-containing n=1 Tax=Fusarium acutatum TaxID=78861 RepID=A0A8H4NGV8_9HYPO|nr:COBW domain-containing [Fusarium acutatum]
MDQLKHDNVSSEEKRRSRPALAKGPMSSWLSVAVTWLRDMTIFKALLIIYCLNVVAWGGMIFLLMCNAAPAMCHPTCDDINSSRKIWIEIDSQILNALFCIPAFWLGPHRCIETWKILLYTTRKDAVALRQLAATYREWFRLPASQTLPNHIGPVEVEAWLQQASSLENIVPSPAQSVPEPPFSGQRAMPTQLWKLQFVVGLNLMNTVFQVILSLFMWCYSRHNRPGWSVGLFLCLAFVSSIGATVLIALERKCVQKVESQGRSGVLTLKSDDDETELGQ